LLERLRGVFIPAYASLDSDGFVQFPECQVRFPAVRMQIGNIAQSAGADLGADEFEDVEIAALRKCFDYREMVSVAMLMSRF
jgi:hypothetical protein